MSQVCTAWRLLTGRSTHRPKARNCPVPTHSYRMQYLGFGALGIAAQRHHQLGKAGDLEPNMQKPGILLLLVMVTITAIIIFKTLVITVMTHNCNYFCYYYYHHFYHYHYHYHYHHYYYSSCCCYYYYSVPAN